MQFGAEPLFENISAKFGNGNRYGLIGANGCGKSTFMNLIGCLDTPTDGHYWLNGIEVSDLTDDELARIAGACQDTNDPVGAVEDHLVQVALRLLGFNP